MDSRDINKDKRLHFLDDLSDYKVASNDPDVRGWNVVDANNNRVGKVDNLLVDPQVEKVRYLDVELDRNLLGQNHDAYAHGKATGVHEYENRDGEVHMIVPVGLARVDNNTKAVVSDEINSHTIRNGHLRKKGEQVTPEHERSVITSLSDAERSEASRSSGFASLSGSPGSEVRETKRHGIPDESRGSLSDRTSDSGNFSDSNREMRRPESDRDTRLTQEARRRDRISETPGSERSGNPEKYSPESTSRYEDDSWSFDTNRNERLGRSEQTRGPVQSNFYTHRYFDEDRFFGRK